MENCHFGGYATRNDLRCSDGRIIRKDAFKHNDGCTVPLIWNHEHSDPTKVLGHALLENRNDGVYAYCTFNDSELGQHSKELVRHGDVRSLSIYANKLKQIGDDVIHGTIRELSLVLAGANPGAYVDYVMEHGDDGEGMIINFDENALTLYHSDELTHAEDEKKEESEVNEEKKTKDSDEYETVGEILDTMNEKQKTAVYVLIDEVRKEAKKTEESEGGNNSMKHNVFDQEEMNTRDYLSHADQKEIIAMAKMSNVGSFKTALGIYAQENELKHGIEDIEQLFPEYKDTRPGAPELIERDYTWVDAVMRKTHKSPISRIRTRQADARGVDITAKGYQKKGDKKTEIGNIKLMSRTTDPQTIYVKDSIHRDDMIDIEDFDLVQYQYGVMRRAMNEKIALATLVGDLREDGDPDKISEEHIRPIWKDDELYTIHQDVDIEAMKTKLQGTNTSANFGEEYIYAEAIISAALYSREQYRGSGTLEFYCTPHLLNVMLLARDLNGRRIYDSKADLAKALNVSAIHTVEQFEGLVRTTKEGEKKKLLGLFANLSDYWHGSAKGGEITKFDQFDIDFNLMKYLIETRLSGALTKIKSAIALEEPVVEAAG